MKKWIIGGVPEHFNVPWQDWIEAQGARSDAARSLGWRAFPGGTGAMIEALEAGRIDIAILLTEGAAAGRARGARFEIVSTYVVSPLIWGIHVPPGSAWRSIDEIAAVRFAISRFGSGSHLMAIALAEDRGCSLAEEPFVVVGSLDGAIEALAGGRADVFLWEHFMTQPVVDRGDFRRIGDFSAPWPAFVVCASPELCAEARDELEALIRAVAAEAGRFAIDPATPERLQRRFGLEAAAAKDWLGKTRWAAGIESPEAGIESAMRVLERAGAIGR